MPSPNNFQMETWTTRQQWRPKDCGRTGTWDSSASSLAGSTIAQVLQSVSHLLSGLLTQGNISKNISLWCLLKSAAVWSVILLIVSQVWETVKQQWRKYYSWQVHLISNSLKLRHNDNILIVAVFFFMSIYSVQSQYFCTVAGKVRIHYIIGVATICRIIFQLGLHRILSDLCDPKFSNNSIVHISPKVKLLWKIDANRCF